MPRRDAIAWVIVVDRGVEVARWPLVLGRCDLSVIEELARRQLEAKRRDCSIRLCDPPDRLRELLHLAGLAGIVTSCDQLVVEMGREPEGREEIGVEEGVEGRDPLA